MLESLVLILFNIALYYKSINFEVIMDDYQWWKTRREKGFTPLKTSWRAFIDDRFYSGTTIGTNLKVEHGVKIFLHIAICLLMYFALGHNQVSFWGAMLYACNPINNQTALWLNGRRYVVNIILVLLMMLIPVAAPLLYVATGLFQVTAFFSPVLLLGHSPWFLLMIPIFLALGYKKIKGKCEGRAGAMADGDLKTFKPTRFIVIVKTFGFFFFKMIIPQVCAMQYPDRIKWGLTQEGTDDAYKIDRSFYIGCGAIACSGLAIYCIPAVYRPWGLFLTLAILQWSAVLPITQILSDRYCSLPNVFMMFFVSYLAHFSGIFYIPIMILVGTYYCICLSAVFPMYKNLTDFYAYHLNHFPHLSWYRHNLIKDLMNEGQHEMASAQTFHGLMHDKKDFRLLIWGAVMSMLKGNFVHAEEFLKEAEKNMYINKAKENMAEIEDLRKQIRVVLPIEKKKERLTAREKVVFINKRKRIN